MNLYVHFPFCRQKCTYCALHSRCGVPASARESYVRRLADAIAQAGDISPNGFSTVYFGGGSPALCDLRPLFKTLTPRFADDCEFTVELHPLDVTEATLATLRAGGVNRISMGVQSLDDTTLAAMGRGYTAAEAARAFAAVKRRFDNAGIDLIVGYPGDAAEKNGAVAELRTLAGWGLSHCSVYSLQLEPNSILGRRHPALPSDDEVLDRIRAVAAFLGGIGLVRYEISNYAVKGRECRHNLAVWRGEDYFGLGEGAFGRVGRLRTHDLMSIVPPAPPTPLVETLSPEQDALERALFRLRTREGLDAADFPAWQPHLARMAQEGLLVAVPPSATHYRLTERGTEVCDAILAELV